MNRSLVSINLLSCMLVCPAFSSDPTGQVLVPGAYVKATDCQAGWRIGPAVAVFGTKLAVGTPGVPYLRYGCCGEVRVFAHNGVQWVQQGSNGGNYGRGGDHLEHAVAIDGDSIVGGTPYEDSGVTRVDGSGGNNNAGDAGAAYICVRNGSTLPGLAYLKASNTGPGVLFGYSVALSGDEITVGAGGGGDNNASGLNCNQADNSPTDSAGVFKRTGCRWMQQTCVNAPHYTTNSDNFGRAVALSGDTLAVRAGHHTAARMRDIQHDRLYGAWSSNISQRLPSSLEFGDSPPFQPLLLETQTLIQSFIHS